MVAALAAASAAPASTADAGVQAVSAATKTKKCKKGQVRVRTGKRRRCLPAKRVLPKPRAGDPRLLLARSTFGRDWSKLRNRRGKRAKSLPKLIRKLGPRAPGLLTRVTSQGVAQLDALIAKAGGTRLHAGGLAAAAGFGPTTWSAAGGCSHVPQGARQQDSFTSRAGGTSATVTATASAEGAAVAMELSGQGYTIKADLDFGACEPNEVEAPECPTAQGQLRGDIRYKLRFSVRVSRGTDKVWFQSADVTRRTKLEGFTDTDAKLDDLDIRDEEISTTTLGGSIRDFPPISIRTRIIRQTRVNMRTGSYDTGNSDVTVTITMAGLYGADRADIQDDLEQKARADLDRQFRAIVEKAMSGYRSREEAWQTANKCATLEFNPPVNTLHLRAGATGSFTATAKAKQDGGISEHDARLSNPEKADYSPTRAGGQQTRFDYTVHTPAGSGKTRAKIRATSRAGVAEDTWEQPLVPVINTISGTFSGSNEVDGTVMSFAGNVTFQRVSDSPYGGANGSFNPVGGQYTVSVSGKSRLNGSCQWSGTSAPIAIDSGGVDASGSGADLGPPYAYNMSAFRAGPQTMTVTHFNCTNSSDNGTATEGIYVAFGVNQQQSPDGVTFSGTATDPGGGTTQTWSMTGTP